MPMNGSFDAAQYAPKQGLPIHPVGKFLFHITNTIIEPTKDGTGGMFVVEFTTPSGIAITRYNLWNQNAKAVEIAHGQLSALCHATGVFRLDWNNDGAALRNARGMVEIGYQKGEEPSAEKPTGGYTEVKRVFDAAGNEPGRAPSAAPQPQQQPQGGGPLQQQPSGSWGNQPQQQPNPPLQQPNQTNPTWGGGAVQQQPQQSGNVNTGAAPTWQQGPGAQAPPWGKQG